MQSAAALSLLSGTTSLGFDNVRLVVRSDGDGKGDRRRRGKSSRLSDSRLLSLLRDGAVGSPAMLARGKRLLVKVNCPGRAGRGCRVAAQGMLNRRKPATRRRVVKIPMGKAKRIALRVKPNARRKLAKRKRLLVRQTVRAGQAKATIYKQRKLIRRP